MLGLEFDTADRAEALAVFVEQQVWSSPGLAATRILDLVPGEER